MNEFGTPDKYSRYQTNGFTFRLWTMCGKEVFLFGQKYLKFAPVFYDPQQSYEVRGQREASRLRS